MERLKRHVTYANVMATIAVFGMLGGGAYAVTSAPKNSVSSKSVRDNSLIGTDIKDDSLTGQDIREDTLQGIQGPQGLPGTQGPPGPTAAGVANRSDPVATPDSINPTGSAIVDVPTSGQILAMASGTITATCTAGNPTLGLFHGPLGGSVSPVPDTQIDLTSGAATPFSIFGLTGTVSPGDHAIVFAVDCPSGSLSPTPTIANNKLGGILIGQ